MADFISISLTTGEVDIIELNPNPSAASATPYNLSFDNGDLVAGELVVTHSLGNQYPSVTVYNNSDKIIMPDDVTATDANTSTIDLTNYGAIAGTWNVVIIG